jgi:hypothetical protein
MAMRPNSKRTVASLTCIAVVLGAAAIVVRWAAPRFGLDLMTQIIIYFSVLFIVRIGYLVTCELNDRPLPTNAVNETTQLHQPD